MWACGWGQLASTCHGQLAPSTDLGSCCKCHQVSSTGIQNATRDYVDHMLLSARGRGLGFYMDRGEKVDIVEQNNCINNK